MTDLPKLKIFLRPWSLPQTGGVEWSVTAILDFPVAHGGCVSTVVNVCAIGGRRALLDRLLTNPTVARYLQELEARFIKEKSTMARDAEATKAVKETATATAPVEEPDATPTPVEAPATTETTPAEPVTAAPDEVAAEPVSGRISFETRSMSPQRKRVLDQVEGQRRLALSIRSSLVDLMASEKETLVHTEWYTVLSLTESSVTAEADAVQATRVLTGIFEVGDIEG